MAKKNKTSETAKLDKLAIQKEIEKIKLENLTGQQLRMARRLASKNGLEPESDLDAVRLLRNININPFENNTVPMEKTNPRKNLPAKRKNSQIEEIKTVSEKQRAKAVIKIQREIIKRRRNRLLQLAFRLFFFVTIPTLIAGYYFYNVATPMYSVKTEFSVQAPPSVSPGGSGLAGALSGGSLLGGEDEIAIQGFLSSIESMTLLDKDHDFIKVFQSDKIDPLKRLTPNVSLEEAHKTYKKNIIVSFEPTEGLLKMEVITPDPKYTVTVSQALIGYAENRIEEQTQRIRTDHVSGALKIKEEAEHNLKIAKNTVLELQKQKGIISVEAEIAAQMQRIATLETTLLDRKLALSEIQDNTRPNKAKVNALVRQISELENLIDDLRNLMIKGSTKTESLALISSQLIQAEAEVAMRQQLLAQSVLAVEAAETEVQRQTKYLVQSVRPIMPEKAIYPRRFENTVVAFLLFAGLYLMISLTASILREQVST